MQGIAQLPAKLVRCLEPEFVLVGLWAFEGGQGAGLGVLESEFAVFILRCHPVGPGLILRILFRRKQARKGRGDEGEEEKKFS